MLALARHAHRAAWRLAPYGRALTSSASTAQPCRAFDAGALEQRLAASRVLAHGYTLQVYTGDRRGASTKANVHATLIGQRGESGPHTLVGEFGRATMQCFYVESDRDLGALRRLRLGHDGTDVGSGWFVDKVVVERHQTGETVEFPCARWLGQSDSGGVAGPLEIDLVTLRAVREAAAANGAHVAAPSALVAAGAAMPRTDKVRQGLRARLGKDIGWGGEDAFWIAAPAAAAPGAQWTLGVADGVGSWARSGIDAGEYSRELARAALSHCLRGEAVEVLGPDADRDKRYEAFIMGVVAAAHASALRNGTQGSSTLCAVHFDGRNGLLTSANVGDSGFIVVRGTEVVYRSSQQEHHFGCPYQLGHHASAVGPGDAQVSHLPAEPGDVVVLGTDGLFDNLGDSEISRFVADTLSKLGEGTVTKRAASLVANRLVEEALAASLDESRDTPFATAATEELGLVYRGGKQDDITVVVGIVTADPSAS